jgi:signal transduction histidine kinase
MSQTGTWAPSESRDTRQAKSSANTSRVSIPRKTAKRTTRPRHWRPPCAKAVTRSEGWRVRKDGTSFLAHVIIDPIRDERGEIIGFAKITRDITERQLAQTQLEEAREALFQSQKMDAVGQLTGGVAHDFNNLLMAVMGSLEMAKKRGITDPSVTRLIDNAYQGAQRGANLTQRMLAFARRQPLNTKALDVAQLVTNMGELLRRSLGPSIELALDFPPGLPHVQADENQLELALLNLSVNARDAMPGSGTIRIGATRETVLGTRDLPTGTYVRLWVRDEGEGMDEATLARAAEPFFTTKGVGKGTGLGLAMVHGMAAQSGGRLTLKSEKGRRHHRRNLAAAVQPSGGPRSAGAERSPGIRPPRPYHSGGR